MMLSKRLCAICAVASCIKIGHHSLAPHCYIEMSIFLFAPFFFFNFIKYAYYHHTLIYLLTVSSKIRRNKRFGVHVFLHIILRFNSLSKQRFSSQKSDWKSALNTRTLYIAFNWGGCYGNNTLLEIPLGSVCPHID